MLDVVMPGMTGLQALHAIRNAAPDARVVLLTSFDRAQVPDAALAATLGLLDKTLDLDALVDRLTDLLSAAA